MTTRAGPPVFFFFFSRPPVLYSACAANTTNPRMLCSCFGAKHLPGVPSVDSDCYWHCAKNGEKKGRISLQKTDLFVLYVEPTWL
jgi:hypothetical protein